MQTTLPMTTTPAQQPAAGVADFDMPMVSTTFKVRTCWLRTLKTVALTRTAQGQPTGVSELLREALAEWADARDIKLNGF